METKDGTHLILWLKCNISWELNVAPFLYLLVIVSIGYHGKGDFKKVTDLPKNLINMCRVGFSHFRQFLSYSVQGLVPTDALSLP